MEVRYLDVDSRFSSDAKSLIVPAIYLDIGKPPLQTYPIYVPLLTTTPVEALSRDKAQ